MSKSVRNLATCSVFTAFSVVFIYLSAVLPTGQLGFSAVASLFVISSIIECGVKAGALVYVAASVLGFLIVPEKSSVLIFIAFFGFYPLVKLFADRINSKLLSLLVKLCVFNLSLFVLIFLFSVTILDLNYVFNSYIILFIIGNVVFVLFDIGLNQVINFYVARISPKIRRNVR